MTHEPIPVPVEPSVMQWLRESAGWSMQDVSKKLGLNEESYLRIETGQKKPTLKQVELLAKAFHRPLASFLLPAPQTEAKMPQDFRLITADKKAFSRKLRRVFRKARWLQDASRELMGNLNLGLESSITSSSITQDVSEAASRERIASGITLDEQKKWKNSYDAFRKWRQFIEKRNIRVFQTSMPLEEARGFSLTDKKPYVIVVNSADDINARIFTLFHEYAHILLSETSVCIPELEVRQDTSERGKVERWCNRFAAEFILPQEAKVILSSQELKKDQPGFFKSLKKASASLKVSQYALLIRMKEFGLVADAEFAPFTERTKEAARRTGGFGKGLTQLERCQQERGIGYVSLVMDNLDRKLINTRDALNYLSVKMKYLDKLRRREGAGNV